MEGAGAVSSEKQQQGASYTYWVREVTEDAAPLPVPRKLTPEDVLSTQSQPDALGSIWNRAGTWEEKNVNKWANDRIKDLLMSIGSLDFGHGWGEIEDVTKCTGDAFLVTVRNKKRVGYTYELTIKVKGEWLLREEEKVVKAYMDIQEFSYGELDDLQMEVKLDRENDLLQQDKLVIVKDLKRFLQPICEKLLQFEQELRNR